MAQRNTRKKRHLKKKKTRTCSVWLSGRLRIEGRSNKRPRLQRKRDKTNVTPEKDVMTSANQTPGGHKFAPHLWLVNKSERTSNWMTKLYNMHKRRNIEVLDNVVSFIWGSKLIYVLSNFQHGHFIPIKRRETDNNLVHAMVMHREQPLLELS